MSEMSSEMGTVQAIATTRGIENRSAPVAKQIVEIAYYTCPARKAGTAKRAAIATPSVKKGAEIMPEKRQVMTRRNSVRPGLRTMQPERQENET